MSARFLIIPLGYVSVYLFKMCKRVQNDSLYIFNCFSIEYNHIKLCDLSKVDVQFSWRKAECQFISNYTLSDGHSAVIVYSSILQRRPKESMDSVLVC